VLQGLGETPSSGGWHLKTFILHEALAAEQKPEELLQQAYRDTLPLQPGVVN